VDAANLGASRSEEESMPVSLQRVDGDYPDGSGGSRVSFDGFDIPLAGLPELIAELTKLSRHPDTCRNCTRSRRVSRPGHGPAQATAPGRFLCPT